MTWENKQIPAGKKVVFASDFHLGVPNFEASRQREDKIVRWLEIVGKDADIIFLVGDIFDFWFEYRDVVPKGFIRFQGKLAQLADAGKEIHFFTGNHDMWLFDYFKKELNVIIHREPIVLQNNAVRILVGHGDGLGDGDYVYKVLKQFFNNPFCQFLFRWLHPNLGFGLAKFWSRKSRISNHKDEHFLGEDEWLWGYCKNIEKQHHHDYYIFGHRHLPLNLAVGEKARYINLGEWFNHCQYVVWKDENLEILTFEK